MESPFPAVHERAARASFPAMSDPALPADGDDAPPPPRRRALLLAAGPLAHLLVAAIAPAELPRPAVHAMGAATWMAIWWLTEAIPLGATALLPLLLFPTLGVATLREAAAPFANEIVFLFLAGFLLAAGLETWHAHARIAYGIVDAIAGRAAAPGGARVVLGMMTATAFVSMWISNTATTAMMYPIALAVGALFGEGEDARRLRTALMLGIAYAASIGGVGTPIGTPPNIIFIGAARDLAGASIGFARFAAMGVPVVLVLLPLCWWLLVRLFPARIVLDAAARAALAARRRALGALRGGERLTIAVFALTAAAWVMREPKTIGRLTIPGLADAVPGVTDATIGLAGALLLFVLAGTARDGTRRPLLTWREAGRIPWETLLITGGGLSLAAAIESTGLAERLGAALTGLAGLPTVVIYLGLAVTVLALSELGSNTAVAAMMMPLAAALARASGEGPVVLMLVTAFAASTGFALPAATPPNLIVFGSGQVSVRQMARAGILLDLVAVVVIVALVALLAPVVLG
jgi:sodium-dependent dicarboxylate transporter 2/3/5